MPAAALRQPHPSGMGWDAFPGMLRRGSSPACPCPASTCKTSRLVAVGSVCAGGRERRIPKDGQEFSQVRNAPGFSWGEHCPAQIRGGVGAELFLCSEDAPGAVEFRGGILQGREWLREPKCH